MKQFVLLSILLLIFSLNAYSQGEDIEGDLDELLPTEPVSYKLKLQRYRYAKPIITDVDTIWCYLLPELPVYPPMKFRNNHQRNEFNKLVYNIKKVLPIAQEANSLIEETYKVLEQLPNKKAKEQHIKNIEKDIKDQYTPRMKKLTYSQGKLLIKLIDRECNQSSYDIVKAFFGPAKASFYQVFAWTFHASLKKEYDPEEDEKLIERIVRQIETGQL